VLYFTYKVKFLTGSLFGEQTVESTVEFSISLEPLRQLNRTLQMLIRWEKCCFTVFF